MGIPGNRTVGRVGSEADPLVARGTEDAIGLELGDVGIGAEVLNALVLGAFGSTAFGRGVSEGVGGGLGGINDRGWWMALTTMSVPVVSRKVVGVVADGDGVAAVVADDFPAFVLLRGRRGGHSRCGAAAGSPC